MPARSRESHATSISTATTSVRAIVGLLLLLVMSAAAANAQTFSAKHTAAGAGPLKVIRADFNNDGIADIAMASSSANAVTILIGNGDGTFKPAANYATGVRPIDLVAVDLNGDGNLDLVTCNDDSDQVHTRSVLLGNGNGTFQAKRDGYGGMQPVGIVAGDFNGDGKADVAIGWVLSTSPAAKVSNQISVFAGDGAGGFTSEILTSDVGEKEQPDESDRRMTAIARGDFNGDKKPDIAFIECCGGFDVEIGDTYVLLGQGDGGFQQVKVGDGSVPQALSVADLNQDGLSDIMLSSRGCHTPCQQVVLLTSNGDGTFTFSANVGDFENTDQYFALSAPIALDANGDGLKDIAVAAVDNGASFEHPNRDVLAVMLRRPDGSYAQQKEFTIGTSRLVESLAVGDYNRDGKLDVATADANSNSSSVLLNTTAGIGCTPGATNRTVKICRPASGSSVTNPVQFLANTTDSSRVTGMKIYVNGSAVFSGDEDSISVLRNLPVGANKVTVRAWDAAGSFSKTITVNVGNGCAVSTVNPSVTICSPADGATLGSPVHVVAKTNDSNAVTLMQIYVDGAKKYEIAATSIDTNLALTAGQHRFTVQAKDKVGQIFKKTIFITVR